MPTKAKPDEVEGKWPSTMWAICQNDKMYQLRDPQTKQPTGEFEPGYGDCYLCNTYRGVKDEKYGHDKSVPTYLTFGLAVVRLPVEEKGSKRLTGLKDELVEHKVKAEGSEDVEILQLPRIVIISQRYRQIWHAVFATAFTPPYTIQDKDFKVARKGNRDSDWEVTTAGYTQDLQPGTDKWAVYDTSLEILGFDLTKWFLSHGEQDHYDRFFIPGRTPKDGYTRKHAADAEQEAESEDAGTVTPGDAGVDMDRLAAYKARMGKRGEKSAAADKVPAEAAAAGS